MCVSTQTGKSNSDAIRIDHTRHDSALTFDHMFDRPCGIIENPSDGRLPSAEDEITNPHYIPRQRERGQQSLPRWQRKPPSCRSRSARSDNLRRQRNRLHTFSFGLSFPHLLQPL